MLLHRFSAFLAAICCLTLSGLAIFQAITTNSLNQIFSIVLVTLYWGFYFSFVCIFAKQFKRSRLLSTLDLIGGVTWFLSSVYMLIKILLEKPELIVESFTAVWYGYVSMAIGIGLIGMKQLQRLKNRNRRR